MEILQLSALKDNYIHLLHESGTGETLAVDPSEAAPVLEALQQKGWRLTHIFNTHHHADHVGGNRELKKETQCRIVSGDEKRTPGWTQLAREGETLMFGNSPVEVLEVPGHTLTHVAYYFPVQKFLFSGDTLFTLGCGRLYEGTPEQMWRSLKKLRALPPDTQVYCGHEYTLNNARFALTVDKQSPRLRARYETALKKRERNVSTVPGSLEEEKATNPFLRADDEAWQRQLGLPGSLPEAVFAWLRKQKDQF